MAIALREFFFPIEKPIPERKPSPYPEPRRPSGVRPPATEAEAAAAAVKIVFGPINWINDQRAIDKRARPWKQVSLERWLGQDSSGKAYALDLRGNWRQFLTHPVKTVKKAAKSLVIRKAYDSIQGALLKRQHELWQAGKITQQNYLKFVDRVGKALDLVGPRDWKKVHDATTATWKEVGTSLTKGSGRVWEWMDFIDNPIGYTMREYAWKKGVRPAISKATGPITRPVHEVVSKAAEPVKEGAKKVAKATPKVIKIGTKKVVQVAAPAVKKALVAAGQALIRVGTQVVVFVGNAVASLSATAASALSASTVAIIVVVVIVLLIILVLITTVGTHSAFLPPELGPSLPGEQFVEMRKTGNDANPLKLNPGTDPSVLFTITYTNVGESKLTSVTIEDDYAGAHDGDIIFILDPSGGVDRDGKLVWTLPDLDPGAGSSISYPIMIKDMNAEQVIVNSAVLKATVETEEGEPGETISVSAQGVVIVGNPSGQPPSGWPTGSGCVSQGFNTGDPESSHEKMNAVDISGVTNQAIYTTHDGKAYVYYGDSTYGNYVLVVSANFQTRYAHLLPAIKVSSGDDVLPGRLLGGMDNTGDSTATHVHYDVRDMITGALVTSQYIPDNSFDGCVDRVTIGGTCDCCFTSREARCRE